MNSSTYMNPHVTTPDMSFHTIHFLRIRNMTDRKLKWGKYEENKHQDRELPKTNFIT